MNKTEKIVLAVTILAVMLLIWTFAYRIEMHRHEARQQQHVNEGRARWVVDQTTKEVTLQWIESK